MDLATLIGLIMGIGAMAFSIISAAGMSGFASFIDVPSLIIVIFGMLAAVLISFPLNQITSILSVSKKAFFNNASSNDEVISKFLEMSKVARTEGLLALERYTAEETDEFLNKSVQMAIDGMQPDTIKSMLTNEIDYLRIRHANNQDVLKTFAAQAPSWGMIGTLIGLVLLLQSLDDPSTIGPSMAVAILTTLYGSVVANFICLPIAKKLEIRSSEETLRRELIIEGVVGLAESASPIVMEQKLKSFLSESQNKALEKQNN